MITSLASGLHEDAKPRDREEHLLKILFVASSLRVFVRATARGLVRPYRVTANGPVSSKVPEALFP